MLLKFVKNRKTDWCSQNVFPHQKELRLEQVRSRKPIDPCIYSVVKGTITKYSHKSITTPQEKVGKQKLQNKNYNSTIP